MTVSMFACCLRLAHSAVVVVVSAPPSPLISIQSYGTGWWFNVPKYFLHLSGDRWRRMQPFEHLLGLCWHEIFKKNPSSSSYLWFNDSWALQCFIQSSETEDKWSMHISSHLFRYTYRKNETVASLWFYLLKCQFLTVIMFIKCQGDNQILEQLGND